MTRQVLVIHCAGNQGPGQGSQHLLAYIRDALGAEYDVLSPKLPNPDNPEYLLWKTELDKEFSALDDDPILIGHSFGGSVLLKYLSEEVSQQVFSGVFILAAPYWGIDENWPISQFSLRDHFNVKLAQMPLFFYHSQNDPIVPFAHLKHYAEKLPQAIVRAIDGYEHFFNDGLPELVDDIKSL